MYNASDLEHYFNMFINNLSAWLPEGILNIDLETLHALGLLNYHKAHDSTLTRYFQVIESHDKITLINEQFIIWVVPENDDGLSKTYVLIALNQLGLPKMEFAFMTSDVYNSSKLVLRILEKFLFDIQENEDSLQMYK